MTESTGNNGSWLRELPRWLMIAAVVSVALNLLVVAALASAYLQSSNVSSPKRGGITRSVVTFVRQLPPERQAVVRSLIKDVRSKVRPLRRSVRKQRGVVHNFLSTEPFDRTAFEAEMEKLLQVEATYRHAARMPLGEIMSLFTVAERKKFVAYHQEWRQRRRGRRK